MARQINRLSARTIAGLPPGKHADGNGLYLYVKDSGTRSWVLMYKQDKKRREKGLGPFPLVSLADARARALQIRREPIVKKAAGETFGIAAEALIESLRPSWKNEKHGQQWANTLKTHAAAIWDLPVDSVDTNKVVEVLRPIWSKIPETASRVRSRIERVLDSARVRGLRSGENPARWRGHLELLLPKRSIQSRSHHPAMPFAEVPAFVKELRARPALSARALEFLILTAARTSEVVKAEWSEFDLDNALWTVPAKRMKMGLEHRVPLSARAMEILRHVKFLGKAKPFGMSNMAMEVLLRRMDRDDFTVHGFRSSFRDWAGDETDFSREVAEAALAHKVGDEVERAYRRGDALKKRRELMDAWETYLR